MDKKYLIIFAVFFIAIIAMSGCTTTKKTTTTTTTAAFAGGVDGLKLTFLPGQPPSQIFENQGFNIAVQIENAGEAALTAVNTGMGPVPEIHYGYISLSGIDAARFGTVQTQAITSADALFPKKKSGTTIMPGGQFPITFTPTVPPIVGAQVQFPVKVSAIYYYSSIASATICLKEDIYQLTVGGKELCKLTGTKPVESSGAPIKVTSVEELPSGFYIKVKNAGSGYPFVLKDATKAFPQTESGIDQYTEKDKIRVSSVNVAGTNITSKCTPSILPLINNEAQFFCQANLTAAAETTDQLVITLEYGYANSVSTTLNVQGTD